MGLVSDDDEAAVAGGPRLEIPEEPEDLRMSLRDALLAGEDWRAGFSDDLCVGVWLWSRWQPALEPVGCSREDFVEIVVSTHGNSGSGCWGTGGGTSTCAVSPGGSSAGCPGRPVRSARWRRPTRTEEEPCPT